MDLSVDSSSSSSSNSNSNDDDDSSSLPFDTSKLLSSFAQMPSAESQPLDTIVSSSVFDNNDATRFFNDDTNNNNNNNAAAASTDAYTTNSSTIIQSQQQFLTATVVSSDKHSTAFDYESSSTSNYELVAYNDDRQGAQSATLPARIWRRFIVLSEQLFVYLQRQLNECSATTIAYSSLFIVLLTILCCVIANLMREEEKRIKDRYKKLSAFDKKQLSCCSKLNSISEHKHTKCNLDDDEDNDFDDSRTPATTTTSGYACDAESRRQSASASSHGQGSRGSDGSTSRLLITGQHNTTGNSQAHHHHHRTSHSSPSTSPVISSSASNILNSLMADFNESLNPRFSLVNRQNGASSANSTSSDAPKLHIRELRRETYFGLVRLLKPGCLTVVLLCDSQSKIKLISKFYDCVYPYRKNKALQFAFVLIEKNLTWYKEMLRMALNERRELHINPINCLGTVLVINGFKKYFSVYHASDSRYDPCEPFVLLEESLLDHLPDWLERLFTGKVSRYYVKYWPENMR